jgi:NAD(P)H dehydrogenase (quinone)
MEAMHIYIVFAHPSKQSFSQQVLEAFTRGLKDAGHSYDIADLYEMGFLSDMDEAQYLRETSGNPDLPVPPDVEAEQANINRAAGLAFIYPVWWSDCPAKLKGWFDRVLTCGYAYLYDEKGGRRTRMSIEKAIVLCSAGHTVGHLEETGIADSMRRIMLNDRLLGVGVKHAHMEVLGGMMPLDNTHRERNLLRAYELGRGF